MHRKVDPQLEALLPKWATSVALGTLFTLIILSLTQGFLPGLIFRVMQAEMYRASAPPGAAFAQVVVMAFLLYVLLACAAGLAAGIAVNAVFRFIWHLAER